MTGCTAPTWCGRPCARASRRHGQATGAKRTAETERTKKTSTSPYSWRTASQTRALLDPQRQAAPRPSKRSEGLRSTSKSSLNQTPALGGTSANKEQGTSSSTKNSSFESDEVENEPNVKPADAESKPQTLAALAKLIDATDVAEVQTLLNVDVAPVAGADVSSGAPEAKPIAKGSTDSTKSGLGEQAAAAVAVAAAAPPPPVPRARTARPEVNGRELEETVKPSARQTPVKSAVKWGGDASALPEPAEQNGTGDVSGVKRRPAVKLSGSLDSLIDESEDGAGPRGILKHSSMSSSDSSLDTPPKSRLTKAISDVHLTPEVMHEKSKSANEDSQGSTEDLEGRHVRFNSNIQQVEVETDFNSPGYTGEGNLDNSDESNSSEEEEEDEEEDKETEENTLKNAGTSSTNPFMNDEMTGDDLFKDFGMDDPAYKSNPFTNQSEDLFVEEPEHELPSLNRHLKTAAADDFWAEDAELELPQSLDPAVPQRQPKVNNTSEDLLDDDSGDEISSLKFTSMQKQPKDAVSNLKDGTNENQLPSLKSTSVQMQPKIARSADLLAEDDENELPYSEPAGLRKPAKPGMKDDTGSTVQERVPTDFSKKPRQDGRTEIQKPPSSSTERSRHDDPDADDNSDGDDDDDEQRRIDRAGGDRQKKFAAEPLKEPSQQADSRGTAAFKPIDDTGAVPSSASDEEGWQSKMPTAQSQTSSLERTGKPKSLQYPSDPSAKANIQASDGQQKVVARSAVSPQVERWLEDATAATLPAAVRSARAGELTDAERKKQMSRSVPVLTVSGEEGEQGIDIDSEDSGSFKLRRAPSDISSISGSMMSLYSDAGDYGNVDVKGEVNFALKYDDRRSELHVCVAQCRDLAAAVAKKGRSDPYVKTYLLPDKSRQSKKKTNVRKNNLNPVYNEILKYKIPARELQSRVLNLSVWHNDKFGKNSFLGEVEMELSTWDWGNTAYNWFDLQPRVHISQEDLTSRGYLNLALKFIPANSVGQFTPASGEIHIWVKEAKNLLPLKPHGVDAFVKCYILPDLSRKSRQKTRTVKKSMNPVFNHTMVYDGFQDEDMREACVELTVWDQETFSNQFLGGLRLGLGGGMSYGKPVDWMDSREGEVAVWHNMITRPGEWTEALLPLRPDMVKSKAKK
ncbi:synaptotagmin-like protein 2 isoform X5 [Lethenteron reissneri]|uniref:synaptotagmin-like protein 2 isoform X5 n=1 Tax=Lethenteron reissneri TaxID=7753 RepID=UPI002AB685A4|nr:synaptotagmin-like protein 2 isoform X5 [Lethenteron reissneri]